MILKVKDIKVGARYRKDYPAMEELAESIRKYGLIEPIVVDEEMHLVAGERRLKAHKVLGLKEIEVKYLKGLDELEKKEIELEENIQRSAFTWQEEVTAQLHLHNLKQKIHGVPKHGHKVDGWGMRDTATALGRSLGSVAMDIKLATGMKAFPELMKEKNKSTARHKLRMKQEMILQEELAKRLSAKGVFTIPDIYNDDAVSRLKKIDALSVDLIYTDPPYGIGINQASTFGKSSLQKTYEDEEFTIFDMLDKVIEQFYRVLKMNRHGIIFCGVDKISRVMELLNKYGFWVHHMPLIWCKGSGSYASQSVTFTHSYESMIHFKKGERKINGTPTDVFVSKRVPSNQKIHPSEKPAELVREHIKLLSLPGEIVLDAFAGSGVVGEAARDAQRRSILIEKDKGYYMDILKRLKPKEEV